MMRGRVCSVCSGSARGAGTRWRLFQVQRSAAGWSPPTFGTESAGALQRPALSPDNRTLACVRCDADNTPQVVLWDVADLDRALASVALDAPAAAMFWLDSGVLLAGLRNGALQVLRWDRAAQTVQRDSVPLCSYPGTECTCVAADSSRRWVAASGESGTVRVWRAKYAVSPHDFPAGYETQAAFDTGVVTWRIAFAGTDSSAPVLAVGGREREVSLWNPQAGQRIGTLPAYHRDSIEACQRLEDALLVTAGRDGARPRLGRR